MSTARCNARRIANASCDGNASARCTYVTYLTDELTRRASHPREISITRRYAHAPVLGFHGLTATFASLGGAS